MIKKDFEIVDYNPKWKELFLIEKTNLLAIFNENLDSIHHIGSTAIPFTKAKPEIDILVVVKDENKIKKHNPKLEVLGYNYRGEPSFSNSESGWYYFSKDTNKVRTHKLHIFKKGNPDIQKKLFFVNYLNKHKDLAIEYGNLKKELSKKYNYNNKGIMKYLDGKSDFINNILLKASL